MEIKNDGQFHYYFYLRAMNSLGYAFFTPQFDVRVIYNCSTDRLLLSETEPTESEIPELADGRLSVISETGMPGGKTAYRLQSNHQFQLLLL